MSRICLFKICNKKVKVTRILNKRVRFRCIRYASLCCRLGGPRLTEEDLARLEKTGFREDQVSDSNGIMKTKSNGDCMFLHFDQNDDRYECQIHDDKPLLCRAFPFFVEPETVNNEFMLAVHPCRGLSELRGRRVNKFFIQNTLDPVLLALINERSKFQGNAHS
jgi:Fe-S-cluster containining protein